MRRTRLDREQEVLIGSGGSPRRNAPTPASASGRRGLRTALAWLCTAAAGPLGAQSPSLTLPPTYPSTATVNQPFDIRITARNLAATASPRGWISVNFPNLAAGASDKSLVKLTGSYDPGETGTSFAKGETIYTCAATPQPMSAKHLLFDFEDVGWGAGETNTITLRVTPPQAGPFTFEVRTALTLAAGGVGRTPTAGPTDQQGCAVARYTITVEHPHLVISTRENGAEYRDPEAGMEAQLWSGSAMLARLRGNGYFDFGPRAPGTYRIDVYQGGLLLKQESLQLGSGTGMPVPIELPRRVRVRFSVSRTDVTGPRAPAGLEIRALDPGGVNRTPGLLTDGNGQAETRLFPALSITNAYHVEVLENRQLAGFQYGVTVVSPFPLLDLAQDVRLATVDPCRTAYSLDGDPGNPTSALSGYEVVFVHGFEFGQDRCEEARSFDVRKYWNLPGEWSPTIQALQKDRHRVWFYRWATFTAISGAGDDLRQRILSQFPAGARVVLVGHSMGGLVAQHALSAAPGLRGTSKGIRAVGLLTLGTPHRGTNFANIASAWLGLPAPTPLGGGLATEEAASGAKYLANSLGPQIVPADRALTRVVAGSLTDAGSCAGYFNEYLPGLTNSQKNALDMPGDCVVGVTSAYGDFDATRRVTPPGRQAFDGYDHSQIRLGYSGSRGSPDNPDALRQAVRRVLFDDFIGAPAASLISSFTVPADTVTFGQAVEVSVTGKNIGTGPSNLMGYLSIGFPQLGAASDAATVLQTPAGGEVKQYPSGQTVWDTSGAAMRSGYLLVEHPQAGWEPQQSNTLRLRVTPRQVGQFVIETKVALQRSDGTYSRAPSSIGCASDQQLACVQRKVVTVVSAPPVALAVVTQPGGAASGVPFTAQPVVELRDASGQPVRKSGVPVTASIASGSGALGGPLTIPTNADGRAAFQGLLVTGAGPHTLRFTAAGLTNGTSNPFEVAPVVDIADLIRRAIQELLGAPSLSPAERTSLDRQGNQDGALDLGDLIALLDANPGVSFDAAALERLMGLERAVPGDSAREPSRKIPASDVTVRKP